MERLAVLAVAAAVAACETPRCVDLDLDGRGEGCTLGPDCDDANAARGADCVGVPPPDCELSPTATGCPCLAGAATDCFPGAPEEAGVGLCRPGRTRCVAGHWWLCDGSQGPRFEICDTRDQDCDGLADEGVRSPCGGCTSGCDGDVWGEPFAESGGGIAITAGGELTLARTESATATIWVPNSAEGTVSRIDAATASETARYATGDRGLVALEPSRVAVDWNGDAWVANRAFGATSSVVRIAGTPDRCVDRDGDLSISTSSGPSDVLPWGADECVTLAVDVGGPGEIARALAIDGNRGLDGSSGGDVWVGLHDGEAFVEIDGLSGIVLRRVEVPGFSPYAAAFDPWGVLWSLERDGYLARIDPRVDPPEVSVLEAPLACWLFYGLAIDGEGRLLVTGFSCDQVTTFDPRTGRWRELRTAASPRGAAWDGTDVWVAHTGGLVSRISLDPLRTIGTHALASGTYEPETTIGMASDGIGSVWAISEHGEGDIGIATRVETSSGAPTAQVEVGLAPHTQGDPASAIRFGEFVDEGTASHLFSGCGEGDPTRWVRLHATIDPGSDGAVRFEVRHAADAASLAGAAWTVLGTAPTAPPPYDLSLPEGGVAEVRLTLSVSARLGAPRVRRVGIEWVCPGPM
jgi:hypothetical protein